MSENNNSRILHDERKRRFMIVLLMTPAVHFLMEALKPSLILQAGSFILLFMGADAILGLRAEKATKLTQEVAAA